MNVVHMARHISKRIVKEARMAAVSNVRERTEKERKQSSHQAMTVVHHCVINQGVKSLRGSGTRRKAWRSGGAAADAAAPGFVLEL